MWFWMLDIPHPKKPPESAAQDGQDVDEDSELGLEHALVQLRHDSRRPVADMPDKYCQEPSDQSAAVEITVLRHVQVVRRR